MVSSSNSSHGETARTERAYRRFIFDAICVVALIAYFLYFAVAALGGGFRDDEMMNLGILWRAGALKSLLANIAFWKVFYIPGSALYDLPLYLHRPGGALYYLPLYHFFKLDPLPYRIVQISILVASIPIVFYLSRLLTSSRAVAFLGVLAFCYHPRLAKLVFVGSFVYDVLCGFFYFAALTYYVHVRERGASLRPRQVLGFVALYVCGLNCKEMAVTLPVIVLIYELLKSPRWSSWRAFFHWSWFSAGPSLIAGLLTALYIYSKTHSSGSLIRLTPYRPTYSWQQFMMSNATFVDELLFTQHAITPTTLLVLWTIVFIYAFMRRDRTLQLMAFWIVIVPLPIAFLLPIRGDAPLYLLLFGWAMFLAKVASDFITLISKSSIFNRRHFRVPATVFVACTLAIFTQYENQRLGVRWLNVGAKTSHLIQTFRSLGFRPRPGSSVLLLLKENLFQNDWNVFFTASLVWNDHSLLIWVEDANQLTSQQQASVDYIILISEFQALAIRSPEVR
jgi:hypothetical protein